MSDQFKTYLKFGGASAVILLLLSYLAYTGVQDSKSYYVTIKELHKMGDGAYSKRLRVAGNVQPGSIKRVGTHVQFVLMEEDQTLAVDYVTTAYFMRSSCRRSAPRNMLRSPELPERLRLLSLPRP
jgi:cytochrome c-type biogenesis protein CcmE